MPSPIRTHRVSLGFVGIAVAVGSLLVLLDAQAQTEPAASKRVPTDSSDVSPSYANFSRVTGTPEELIFDFGLNATPAGAPLEPVKIEHRIVMNFYTAKRLLMALQQSIDRHEAAFGPIEIDVNKRVINR